jgi:hypothetical protein
VYVGEESSMAIRPPERVLDDIVAGKGRGGPIRRKLVANRERNWLLALTLNSFAKFEEGSRVARLTDLEQSIVTAFRGQAFSDDEIKQQGALAKRLPKQFRDEIFPGKFAGLNTTASYSFADLKQDAPNIAKALLAMPNVNRIDVEAIHAGRRTLRDFPPPDRKVLREHASEILVAVEPNVAPHNPTYTIKATSFDCIERATDSIFNPSNEPYWIFGLISGGTAVTTRSEVFSGVNNNSHRDFKPFDGCIWGQNCGPQDLPDSDIGAAIQLWEHDEGDVEKVKATAASAFALAAGILAASGVGAVVAAVVAAAGAVLQWFISLMDDDHIADQTIVFTRQVVENQLGKSNQTVDMQRRFTDGDGDYVLTIRLSRFP